MSAPLPAPLPPSASAPPAAPRAAPRRPPIPPGLAIRQARSPPLAQSAGTLGVTDAVRAESTTGVGAPGAATGAGAAATATDGGVSGRTAGRCAPAADVADAGLALMTAAPGVGSAALTRVIARPCRMITGRGAEADTLPGGSIASGCDSLEAAG